MDTLGLLGYISVVVRPPLFWTWEGLNYPSRSRNGPNGPKGPKLKKNEMGRVAMAGWTDMVVCTDRL